MLYRCPGTAPRSVDRPDQVFVVGWWRPAAFPCIPHEHFSLLFTLSRDFRLQLAEYPHSFLIVLHKSFHQGAEFYAAKGHRHRDPGAQLAHERSQRMAGRQRPEPGTRVCVWPSLNSKTLNVTCVVFQLPWSCSYRRNRYSTKYSTPYYQWYQELRGTVGVVCS